MGLLLDILKMENVYLCTCKMDNVYLEDGQCVLGQCLICVNMLLYCTLFIIFELPVAVFELPVAVFIYCT